MSGAQARHNLALIVAAGEASAGRRAVEVARDRPGRLAVRVARRGRAGRRRGGRTSTSTPTWGRRSTGCPRWGSRRRSTWPACPRAGWWRPSPARRRGARRRGGCWTPGTRRRPSPGPAGATPTVSRWGWPIWRCATSGRGWTSWSGGWPNRGCWASWCTPGSPGTSWGRCCTRPWRWWRRGGAWPCCTSGAGPRRRRLAPWPGASPGPPSSWPTSPPPPPGTARRSSTWRAWRTSGRTSPSTPPRRTPPGTSRTWCATSARGASCSAATPPTTTTGFCRPRSRGPDLSERVKDAIAHGNATALIQRFRPQWEPDLGPVGEPDGPILGPFADVDLWRTQPGQPARLV